MNLTQPREPTDPRSQQTRQALFEAFVALVLSRNYDEISISDIIAKAGVSRSTFYRHYRNKDHILAGSMDGILSVLAATATGTGRREDLDFILSHLWDNRQLGRVILRGPPYRTVAGALTQMIEQKLAAGKPDGQSLRVNARLRAVQLSEGVLGTIRAWIDGRIRCSLEDLSTYFETLGFAPSQRTVTKKATTST